MTSPRDAATAAGPAALLLAWIVDKLARSPSFAGRPDRREVEAALQSIAHRVLAQRDWNEERPITAIPQTADSGRP